MLAADDGTVLGTGPHKYGSRNPLAKRMLRGFHEAVAELAASVRPRSILEIGCGEGYVTHTLLEATDAEILSLDLDDRIIAIARHAVSSPRVRFATRSIYDVRSIAAADLVICCEVLEHLTDPGRGLEAALSVSAPYCLLSVPREPIWRILNCLRGVYVRDWGNSPGHVQHWSKAKFVKWVASHCDVRAVRSPFPWTMLLVERS